MAQFTVTLTMYNGSQIEIDGFEAADLTEAEVKAASIYRDALEIEVTPEKREHLSGKTEIDGGNIER